MTSPKVESIPVFVIMPQPVLLLDMAGPLEVLRVVNRERGANRFDVRYVGPVRSLMTSIGIALTGIEPLPSELPDGAMVILTAMWIM